MTYAIETSGLTKSYQKTLCVNHIHLKVPFQSIYGFLGPNGAGKSTTMKMLLGLVKPTQGSVSILGKPLNSRNRLSILKSTGSLIESPSYYAHLTGRENLALVCMMKNVPESDIDRVLAIVRMEKQQNKKAGHYSLGMKQRLGLAAALIGQPDLLLLDEPTNGLDPAGIQEMRELICSLPEKYGITVMVSSHLLSEIQQMTTHTGIIHKGSLIFQGTMEELKKHSQRQLKLKTDNNPAALHLLESMGLTCQSQEGYLLLPETNDRNTAELAAYLVENKVGLLRLEEKEKSLEEIFLSLTGRQVSL